VFGGKHFEASKRGYDDDFIIAATFSFSLVDVQTNGA